MKTLRLLLAFIILISALGHSIPAVALDLGYAKEDGGQAGAFLDFAASARSLGMGRAQSAVTDDSGSTYWNPAGLARVDRGDILALYSALPESTNFSVISYAQPTASAGTFGLSVVSLRSSGFDKRDENGQQTGTFSNSQLAVMFANGFGLTDRLSLGGTVKVIRHDIDNFSATGYGVDLGLIAKMTKNLDAALTTHNILAPKIQLDSHADVYPRDIRLGLKYQPREKLILASDVVKTKGRSTKLNFGVEYWLRPMFAIRAGINETEIAMGFGLKQKDWGLDYAFGYHDAVPGISDLGTSHRVGVHVNFGKRYSEEVAAAHWMRRGAAALASLREAMDHSDDVSADALAVTISAAKQAVAHHAYPSPQDLYECQAYIYYFENDYERSYQSLTEALSVSADSDGTLVTRRENARLHMNEAKLGKLVETEIAACKDDFNKNNFRAALAACEQLLKLKPDHVEAKIFAEDARKKIYEPIEREMKIAAAHFEQREYLDVLKDLNAVKQMDPENKDASELMTKTLEMLDKEAAQPAVVELNQNSTESRKFYGEGLILYSQGKLKDAAQAWGEAVKQDSRNALARNAYNRAMTELKEKAQ